MPTVGGQTATELSSELAAQAGEDQPAELKQLFSDLARTCAALATARGNPNWHAVRVKAMKQASLWVKQAEHLLDARKSRS